MSNPIALYIAIANAPSDVDVEGLFRFIEENDGDFETYALAPPEPGQSRKAAFDYVLWLNMAGSAASIAALLWTAYDRFIAPKVKKGEEDAHIHVGIHKPDGSAVEYRIDNLQGDKEVVILDFEATVSEVQRAPGARKATEQAEFEVKCSGMWVRRK